ncbi:MAG: hypothetical protein ABII74_06325 [Elusimicrobiota bacterium]
MKKKIKGLLEKKMENAAYRKRHEEDYQLFQLEVQFLNALEKKQMTYNELAKRLHTQKSNISRDLKAGGMRHASLSRIEMMAEALGLKFLPLVLSREQEKTLWPKIQKLVMA